MTSIVPGTKTVLRNRATPGIVSLADCILESNDSLADCKLHGIESLANFEL